MFFLWFGISNLVIDKFLPPPPTRSARAKAHLNAHSGRCDTTGQRAVCTDQVPQYQDCT